MDVPLLSFRRPSSAGCSKTATRHKQRTLFVALCYSLNCLSLFQFIRSLLRQYFVNQQQQLRHHGLRRPETRRINILHYHPDVRVHRMGNWLLSGRLHRSISSVAGRSCHLCDCKWLGRLTLPSCDVSFHFSDFFKTALRSRLAVLQPTSYQMVGICARSKATREIIVTNEAAPHRTYGICCMLSYFVIVGENFVKLI